MRFSQAFIPTLREVPSDAELISHRLLLRAGYMRKLSSGVYSWLPLGVRVLQKVAAVIRDETIRAGGQEVLLPALQPREIWEETGRADVDVLFRLQDRARRDMVLGMTHEEVVTDLARTEIRSYRQLPVMMFQIQTKFRDEQRPRGGALRCREFTMQDCYSLHATQESLNEAYERMHTVYKRALTKLGLDFMVVEAESGAHSGGSNHQFVAVLDSGEDRIFICEACNYAASAERCEIGDMAVDHLPEPEPLRVVETPECRTVAQVTAFLGIADEKLIKTLIYQMGSGESVAALVRGDRDLNEAKLARALGGVPVRLADAEVTERVTGAPVGFAGPQGLSGVRILADRELKLGGNWVTGANRPDAHALNVNEGRDFAVDAWVDLRAATDGDVCPRCAGTLGEYGGVEAAHIFQMGSQFSEAMGAVYQDAEGAEHPVLMGSYGFGVSRAVAVIAEQWADADGLLWPATVAPYDVELICLNSDQVTVIADRLYRELQEHGLAVLYDDRDDRAGVKFKDADLIGIPIQVVVGKNAREGRVEIRLRGRGEKQDVSVSAVAAEVARLREMLLSELSADGAGAGSPAA